MRIGRLRARRATLGQFVRSWDGSLHRDSDEKVVVAICGPILLVLPAERRAWRASKPRQEQPVRQTQYCPAGCDCSCCFGHPDKDCHCYVYPCNCGGGPAEHGERP